MEENTRTTPEERSRTFDRFYHLTAAEVMESSFAAARFIAPHGPVEAILPLLLDVDHLWVSSESGREREIQSIVLRQDILHALQPTHASYTRFSKTRFRSLSHGSADCVCHFTEGRVLHTVTPAAPCSEVLRVMEVKGVKYVPVLEDGLLVGEIGALQLVAALNRLYRTPPEA